MPRTQTIANLTANTVLVAPLALVGAGSALIAFAGTPDRVRAGMRLTRSSVLPLALLMPALATKLALRVRG